MRQPTTSVLLMSMFVALASPAGAADWPQFRGPRQDGISTETGLARSWPESGPPVRWRVDLGEGYSGLSVVGERIYTAFAGATESSVVALSTTDGREIWRRRLDAKWSDSQGNGPRATPTVADGAVYALSGNGRLVALNAADGKQLWAHDLRETHGARPPRWGFSSSPLVAGDRLLVEVGGRDGALFVAFDRKTGRELWRAGKGKPAYATPLLVETGGTRQAVFFPAEGLVAVDPQDGTVLWRFPWSTAYDVNAAMPLRVPPDRLFLASGYDVGAAMLRIGEGERGVAVEQLWRSREMKNQFSSAVFRDGTIFGFDNRTLKALDAASGTARWRARGLGHGTLTYADGQLIVLGENGVLLLVAADGADYVERARFQLFRGKCWTVPTLSNGTLYARNEQVLVALDLAE